MAATSLPWPCPLPLLLALAAALLGEPGGLAAGAVATSRRSAEARLVRSDRAAVKSRVEEAPVTLAEAWLKDLDAWKLVKKLAGGIQCSEEGAFAVAKYVNKKDPKRLLELNASIVDEGSKNKCVSVFSTPPHKMMTPSAFRPLCSCANMLELSILRLVDEGRYNKRMLTWMPTQDHEIASLTKQWLDGEVNSWGLAEDMFLSDVCSRVAVQEMVILVGKEADANKMKDLDKDIVDQMKAHAGDGKAEGTCLRRLDLAFGRPPEAPGPALITPGINAKAAEKEVDGIILARRFCKLKLGSWGVGKRMKLIKLCNHDFALTIVKEVSRWGQRRRLIADSNKKVASSACRKEPLVCECVEILGRVAFKYKPRIKLSK